MADASVDDSPPAANPLQRVSILVADDHGFIRAGVEAVLRGSRFDVVGGASTGEETLTAVRDCDPTIVLLDVNMPGMNGVRTLEVLRGRGDKRKVVLLTAEIADADLERVIAAGVEGIIFKDGAEEGLVDVLERVAAGDHVIYPALLERARSAARRSLESTIADTLSPREWHVARLVAHGLRNRDIGIAMNITEGTVKVYLHAIYLKLKIDNRTELAMMAVREGILTLPVPPSAKG